MVPGSVSPAPAPCVPRAMPNRLRVGDRLGVSAVAPSPPALEFLLQQL